MSEHFTEPDVTAGGKAIHSAWVRLDEGMDLFGKPAHEHLARAVLTAVAPAMRDRWREEYNARADEVARREQRIVPHIDLALWERSGGDQ